MKRWLTLVLFAGFAILSAGCAARTAEESGDRTDQNAAETWSEYTSPEGGFSVMVPKRPVYQTQEASTEVGPIIIHSFFIEHGQMAYAVMYNDIPGDLPDVPDALTKGREGTLATAGEGAELVYEKDVAIDGNPGLEFRINVPDPPGVYTARMFVVNDRLFQVMTMSPAGVDAEDAVFKFLDSFELE